jgi:hypothetical protein
MQAQQPVQAARVGGDGQAGAANGAAEAPQAPNTDVPDVSTARAGPAPMVPADSGQYWHLQEQLFLRQQQERQNSAFPSGVVMGVQPPGMPPGHAPYYFGQGFSMGPPQHGYFDQRQFAGGMPMPADSLGRGGMSMGGLPHMGRHFHPQGMLQGGLPDFAGMIPKADDVGVLSEQKGRKVPKRSLAATIERMEKHKLLERKRRERTKELMTELQSLVPMQQEAGDNPTMNMILEEAIEYLKTQQWEAAARAKHPCTCGAPGVGNNPMPPRPKEKREREDDESSLGVGNSWTGPETFSVGASGNSSGEAVEDENGPAAPGSKMQKTGKE